MGKFVDKTGQRFGHLVANCYLGSGLWHCVCDCGSTTEVLSGHLSNGNTKSCGCRKRSVLGESTTTHGMAGTRAHRIWKAMRSRCNNQNHPRYCSYGGRGVKVCERWDDFANFYADMGEPPPGFSIDRIDNDGDYAPDNCRWASPAEQNRNRRSSLTLDGLPLKQWAQANGVSYGTAYRKAKHSL